LIITRADNFCRPKVKVRDPTIEVLLSVVFDRGPALRIIVFRFPFHVRPRSRSLGCVTEAFQLLTTQLLYTAH
jgi:hypothetical protein